MLFRQYSEAPQIGCAFVDHLMIQMQTMILNQKLIVNHYQILILIVIDSLKLKYLLMLKLIQVQRYSMMLTQMQILRSRLILKLKPTPRLRLIRTSKRIQM